MPAGTKNSVIPGCGLHHISIQTQNFKEAVDFYCNILGMTLRLEFNVGGRPYVLLDMGDGSFLELQAPKPETGAQAPANPLVHFALATHDVRGVAEKVRAAGYQISVEPKDVQLNTLSATVAFFIGPSGESVELFHEK